MAEDVNKSGNSALRSVMGRLARDRAGNTLAMVAAAIAPILAMVGSGIDMGRSYLSETRLQQACDSGVLAARKKLGATIPPSAAVPADVNAVGQKFFKVNFKAGAYGTANRQFNMSLENDFSVSGVATVDVPTTIMRIFGFNNVPVSVNCTAKLNYSNTDIMMVLDTTGSMQESIGGVPKIDSLKDVVRSFYAQIEAAKGPGTRIRYGFVPYSTNVNVGGLLHDDWVVTDWKYQSREQVQVSTNTGTWSHDINWAYVSGGASAVQRQSSSDYAATWHPPVTTVTTGSTTIDANENVVVIPATTTTAPGYYTCDSGAPGGTATSTDTPGTSYTTPFAGPPAGTRTVVPHTRVTNGRGYWNQLSGSQCQIYYVDYTSYTDTYDWVTDPTETAVYNWHYAQLDKNVSNWRNESNGCIEERATYNISDYANVDFDRALDLDIDRVPDANDETKWRPMYPWVIYSRSVYWDGSGSFTPAAVTNADEYMIPAGLGLAACPAASRKLAAMTTSEVDDYLNTLNPTGSTYHDIGMIWGGRLLSPAGIFAADNADENGKVTSRNLIFLTDGQTDPLDLSYSSYGVEPLDQRRWSPPALGGHPTLTETVESRFAVACDEVKKRNITVWVIAFGTNMSPMFSTCAGNGHYFQADDAAALNDIFSKIATSLGDLRISK